MERDNHPDGFKLVFGADWLCQDYPQLLTESLAEEAKWQQSRERALAAASADG